MYKYNKNAFVRYTQRRLDKLKDVINIGYLMNAMFQHLKNR